MCPARIHPAIAMRRRPTNHRWMEALEGRRLLTASVPTNYEQYLLELVNRARANPAAEASRYGIALNEGLPAGTITSAAKQPLAFNLFLVNAARGHSLDMRAHNYFAHQGSNGKQPQQRMAASGYVFDSLAGWGNGENIAWTGTTGAVPKQGTATAQMHRDLFVDAGIAGRGHRTNLLNPGFQEVGVGLASGAYAPQSQSFNSVLATEDFAYVNGHAFLTGVAYADTVTDDNFYTPGEGLAGVKIKAVRTSDSAQFTTTTLATGGYTLALSPGTYNITGQGGGLAAPITFSSVVIGSSNVKRDFVPGQTPPLTDHTPPTGKLTAAAITKTAKAYSFSVTYTDDTAVKAATVTSGDVKVIGPHGFKVTAAIFSKTSSANSARICAVYRILAPNDGWSKAANGKYTVVLQAGEISDTASNFAAAQTLGSFTVNVTGGKARTQIAY